VLHRLTAWRDRVRRTPGGRQLLKLGVFALGLFFVLLGVALIVLPGPLTIPPILLGVYIWSTEFAWADRLKDRAVESARDAWEAARRKPVTSAVVTGGGVLLAVAGAFAVRRYDVVDRLTGSFG
jgi:ABC-type Fe3+ transport system permease subunit